MGAGVLKIFYKFGVITTIPPLKAVCTKWWLTVCLGIYMVVITVSIRITLFHKSSSLNYKKLRRIVIDWLVAG